MNYDDCTLDYCIGLEKFMINEDYNTYKRTSLLWTLGYRLLLCIVVVCVLLVLYHYGRTTLAEYCDNESIN